MTPKRQCLLRTVQELIDPVKGGWDEQLVNFWPVDVERIIQIPLPSFGQPDFIAWHSTKSGCFCNVLAEVEDQRIWDWRFTEMETRLGEEEEQREGQGRYLFPFLFLAVYYTGISCL
jgi:hypothetical protein